MQTGIIEGFYGETWGWDARTDALPFLAERGVDFFLYAPKGDRHLRGNWKTPHPAPLAREIRDFGAACRQRGLKFGVGLTPYRLHETWDEDAGREALAARVRSLKRLHLDWLAILFDDMPGSLPQLARTQAEMIGFIGEIGEFERLVMCPTYYTDQSILDSLFGLRPPHYLRDLGRLLDPSVGICWTGPRVVSLTYPEDHLHRVADEMGRLPFIWDNYPVNDGPRMSRFLHLRAPERPPGLQQQVSDLAINPMNQSWLSRIPIDAALHGIAGRARGSLEAQTDDAIDRLLGAAVPTLAAQLKRDWRSFQDEGLDRLPAAEKRELVDAYGAIPHPAAVEVTRWLKGEYIVSADILTDA